MKEKKRILVAPLNWGLGHATRCIPIINELVKYNFEPVIATDGIALDLLRKEFPELETVELPSYNIKYPKNGFLFKLKIFLSSPKILSTTIREHKKAEQLVESLNINGIISDNRLGFHSKKVPSIFITHQLRVLSGITTWVSSKIHHLFINQFDECWIPDYQSDYNLSGILGHKVNLKIPKRYLGPLSRFSKKQTEENIDILVLLSGPEPQRTLLEERLLEELSKSKLKIEFIRGVVEDKQVSKQNKNIKIVNFLTSVDLEEKINMSKLVLCRSGYTTVMDLAKLEKKAFFIPTPGQTEQEYLAEKLEKGNIAPSKPQQKFKLKHLEGIKNYKGFTSFENNLDGEKLFSLF